MRRQVTSQAARQFNATQSVNRNFGLRAATWGGAACHFRHRLFLEAKRRRKPRSFDLAVAFTTLRRSPTSAAQRSRRRFTTSETVKDAQNRSTSWATASKNESRRSASSREQFVDERQVKTRTFSVRWPGASACCSIGTDEGDADASHLEDSRAPETLRITRRPPGLPGVRKSGGACSLSFTDTALSEPRFAALATMKPAPAARPE